MSLDKNDLSIFPGGDLVVKGLEDLRQKKPTEEALLVAIAGPRLRSLGFDVEVPSDFDRPYEHALYEALERRMPNGAHAMYNSLIQKVVSFAESYNQTIRAH
jgi:hypothetical protein